MRCQNPLLRECDTCGAAVSEWCEYRDLDLCLACDANGAVTLPFPAPIDHEAEAAAHEERVEGGFLRLLRDLFPKRAP